jgi:DNA-binding NarL/FixJ family response regulator
MTRPQFHTTPWTPAEEERLRAMIVSGMSVKDIATEHQRSVGAVRARSEQLGISLKRGYGEASPPDRSRAEREIQMNSAGPTRRPWTTGEQKKLDDLLRAGKTGREIATALQRTPQSIYSQLHRLDIKRKKAARRMVQIGLKAKK